MIQRIQSLYLLLVAGLAAVTLFVPLATFRDYETSLDLTAFALVNDAGVTEQPAVYLGIVLVLACILPFVTIFLYRRRLLQIRLCVVEMVLLLGGIAMEGIYYYLSLRAFSGLEHPDGSYLHTPHWPIALPAVCLLFSFLAARAVFRDEMLVRAADRIR